MKIILMKIEAHHLEEILIDLQGEILKEEIIEISLMMKEALHLEEILMEITKHKVILSTNRIFNLKNLLKEICQDKANFKIMKM